MKRITKKGYTITVVNGKRPARNILILYFAKLLSLFLLVVVIGYIVNEYQRSDLTEPVVEVLWPQDGSVLLNEQEFQVQISTAEDVDPDMYTVRWVVDEGVHTGKLEHRGNGYFSDLVDVRMWDWKRDGVYALEFLVLSDEGTVVALHAVDVTTRTYTGGGGDSVGHESDIQDTRSGDRESDTVHLVPSSSNARVEDEGAENGEDKSALEVSVRNASRDGGSSFTFTFESDLYDSSNSVALWQSKGGHRNLVSSNEDGQHYVTIDFSGWRWIGEGPYEIIFSLVSKSSADELASERWQMFRTEDRGEVSYEFSQLSSYRSVPTEEIPARGSGSEEEEDRIFLETPQPSLSPLPDLPIYRIEKPAVRESLESASATEKELLRVIYDQPGSVWLNGDGHDRDHVLERIVKEVEEQRSLPVFVLYNIPHRDCGSHSSGGAQNADEYRRWIDRVARALESIEAVYILEPDALAQLNCTPSDQAKQERIELMRYAVEVLSNLSGAYVYIDAGHPFWIEPDNMADRLRSVNVQLATGFSLNVSNFVATDDVNHYGNYLSYLTGGAGYVVDTSRNGRGQSGSYEWCNPRGRALGELPQILHGHEPLHAFLWIKYPGESDGVCNGGPSAGQWWKEYALELVRNR